jgi:hypothetical protein
VTGGAKRRIGRSDAFGGEREPMPEAGSGTNGHAYEASEPPERAAAVVAPATRSPEPGALSSRQAAIDAYCLELCGADRMRIAAEEVISSLRLSGPVATVSEQELLSVTRATASGFAPQVLSAGSAGRGATGPYPECELTLPRLARRANGELDRVSRAALTEHLARCVVCRAAEARHERADRAFAAVLGIGPRPLEAAVETEPLPAPEPPVEPALEAVPVVPEPLVEPEPAPVPVLPQPPAPELDEPAPELDEPAPLEPAPLEPPSVEPEAVLEPEPVEQQPLEGAEPMRGLVVLPAAIEHEQPTDESPFVSVGVRRSPLRGWTVLIATLVLGAVVVVLIAVLWSSGSSNPDPRSLPPASAAASAAVLGATVRRTAPALSRPSRHAAAERAATTRTRPPANNAPTGFASTSTATRSSSSSSSGPRARAASAGQPQPSNQSGSGGGPVASQAGGGNLPPAAAPTKTIGSMFK